jgi:hypothetical protein
MMLRSHKIPALGAEALKLLKLDVISSQHDIQVTSVRKVVSGFT